jgi:hypothetical protein
VSLLSEASQKARPKKGPACTVGRWLAELPELDRIEVNELLASRIGPTICFDTITDHWPDPGFTRDTLTRHVRSVRGVIGGCACRS